MANHYAIIGMASVKENFPLYYDGVNEKGLAMAGLNFVDYAVYQEPSQEKENVALFEFIPWLLSQCASVPEARALLSRVNLTGEPFQPDMPPARLHWLIADRSGAIVVEPMAEGPRIYDNPAGVLTNNPTFPEQMFHLNNYMHLSPRAPENRFAPSLPLNAYSRGMGALGLPGDLSSQSRFVRVAFTRMNAVSGESEADSVTQFFHILGSVEQQRGCCDLGDGKYEITLYTSCCNVDRGIYYYTTYENSQITGVDMGREDLEEGELIRYPLIREQQMRMQNG